CSRVQGAAIWLDCDMAYEELKQRQSVMWGSGPYQRVTETIADIHERVVEALKPRARERWLDLACGTGAVAERAARAGAKVTGLDLAPALLEQAKARAQAEGLEIDYRVGDCEKLDGIEDGSFDIVSSTCGIMFAPDHAATARQLARVLKSGGRLGLANWTPEGGLGAMFRMMAPFVQTPPPSSPFDWGKEERVRELLGESFDLRVRKAHFHVSPFERRRILGNLFDRLRPNQSAGRFVRPAPGRVPSDLGGVLRTELQERRWHRP
ncbi:MAG TPA: methyltransferase domain-containing protein, partial [Chthoniobacterales bacterium]